MKRGVEPAAIRRESRRDPQLGGVVHGEGAVTVGQAQVEFAVVWASAAVDLVQQAVQAAAVCSGSGAPQEGQKVLSAAAASAQAGWGFPADPSGRKGTRGLSCRSLNSRPSSTRRYSPGSCPQRIGQAGARQPDEDGHAHTAVAEQPAYVVPYAGPGYSFSAPWM